MFGKQEPAKFDPSEFRVHNRRVVKGVRAYVDTQEVEVLDYSDGGMRVSSPNPLPRVAVVEIFKNGKLVRNIAAVTAWARSGQTGYAFRSKLKVTNIQPSARTELQNEKPAQNETGGVTGNALRDRLKL